MSTPSKKRLKPLLTKDDEKASARLRFFTELGCSTPAQVTKLVSWLERHVHLVYVAQKDTLKRILGRRKCLESLQVATHNVIESTREGVALCYLMEYEREGDIDFGLRFLGWQLEAERLQEEIRVEIQKESETIHSLQGGNRKGKHFLAKKLCEDIAIVFVDNFLKRRYQDRNAGGKPLVARKRRYYHGCGLLHYLGIWSIPGMNDAPFPERLDNTHSMREAYSQKLKEAKRYLAKWGILKGMQEFLEGRKSKPK